MILMMPLTCFESVTKLIVSHNLPNINISTIIVSYQQTPKSRPAFRVKLVMHAKNSII